MKDKIIEVLHKYDYDIHMTIDQAAASIMELVDKEKIELFKSEIERLQKQKRSLEVLHANSSDVTLLTSRRLGGKMEGIELALENLRQTIQQFSQSKPAK